MNKNQKGSNNPNWKGGVALIDGYRYIYSQDHPNCTKLKYVCEHRLVVEKDLGRYLKCGEVVHHINGDKLDNRIENLELCKSTGKHAMQHHVRPGANGDFVKK